KPPSPKPRGGRDRAMPDAHWPTDWEVSEEHYAYLQRPFPVVNDPATNSLGVVVFVPLDLDGKPDLDGLLARLRLDPKHALPVAIGADCRTTHYACQCVMEHLEKAEAEVERLRAALQERLVTKWRSGH